MLEPITLSVGQVFHLKRGKDRIIYAGMVSENIYSIAQMKYKGAGHQGYGYGWNLFFQKRRQYITIDGVNISVENVTPEEIRLRVE